MSFSAPATASPCSKRATASAAARGRSAAATGSSRPAGPTSSRPSIPGLYFNSGPARIPSTHRLILGYARRFGVQLEPFINVNRNAGWDFGGKVQPERRMVEDMRGHLAELLAKAIDRKALDGVVPKDELDAVRQFLAPYASVGADGVYAPTGRSGLFGRGRRLQPGAGAAAAAWREGARAVAGAIVLPYLFEHIWDMQATMLQPVGGMDRIAHAIYDQVKPAVRLRTPVSAIRRAGDRVRIEHGPGQVTEADYCICTMPLPVLARIPSDFSPAKKAAIAAAPPYLHSVKLAFEAPRFWESDDNIFGGLAWTDRLNENVMYPSGGIGNAEGRASSAPIAPAGPTGTRRIRSRRCRTRSASGSAANSIEALHPGPLASAGQGRRRWPGG